MYVNGENHRKVKVYNKLRFLSKWSIKEKVRMRRSRQHQIITQMLQKEFKHPIDASCEHDVLNFASIKSPRLRTCACWKGKVMVHIRRENFIIQQEKALHAFINSRIWMPRLQEQTKLWGNESPRFVGNMVVNCSLHAETLGYSLNSISLIVLCT